MNQQLVTTLADENGRIEIEQDSTDFDGEFQPKVSIRDDDLQLFESDSGELFMKTPDMPQELFVEVIPTSQGPTTQITTEVSKEDLRRCEPAERAESPEVESRHESTVIMD